MKLYEIDAAIEEAMNRNVIDEETGEVIAAPDMELIVSLQMERERKLENVALFYKNAMSDVEALTNEIKAFTARKKALQTRAESAKAWLDTVLAGETINSVKVAVTYRKSKEVVVDDLYSIPEEYLRYKEPEPNKVAIKKAIDKDGLEVPGVHVEEKNNIQIK